MEMVVDSRLMKKIDYNTIHNIGIPSMVLMERAALAVVDCIKKHTDSKDKILAICGIGNNGADGIATVRILKMQGYDAQVLLIGDIQKGTAEIKEQINIARKLGISIYNNVNLEEYTVIIDAIIGIGLNKPVQGIHLDYIKEINKGNHTVFSVDIPSGLSASTARPLKEAIKADYTVTFGFNKVGLTLYPGCEYAGNTQVADIGFPPNNMESDIYYYTYDKRDLKKLPKRKRNSNKGDFGKVLIIAGSDNMNGACFLAAKAAYRIGAGLVKVLIPEDNRVIMQTMLPEAILSTYDKKKFIEKDLDHVLADISWATSIVIGPGLGKDQKAEELVDLVLNNSKVPVIIDADGINILSKKINKIIEKSESDTKDRIQVLKNLLPSQTILTPHIKELSRLLDKSVEEIKENILKVANFCTHDNSIVFAIKDGRTIVASKNKRYINLTGNNGMSTGGSGDVLSGIIGGLIAQKIDLLQGTELAVYIHGLAGDIVAKEKNQYSLIASDLIEALAKI